MTSSFNDLTAIPQANCFSDLALTQVPEALSRYNSCLPQNRIAQSCVNGIKVGDRVRDIIDNWFGTVVEVYTTSTSGTIYVRVEPDDVLKLHRSDVVQHKGIQCILPRDFGAHWARYVPATI